MPPAYFDGRSFAHLVVADSAAGGAAGAAAVRRVSAATEAYRSGAGASAGAGWRDAALIEYWSIHAPVRLDQGHATDSGNNTVSHLC